jgi:hypothetical protein
MGIFRLNGDGKSAEYPSDGGVRLKCWHLVPRSMRRLDDPTQLPSLVIRSLPRSREGFVIRCLCPTLEDEVRLSARLDVDRAEVRQSDDDLSTLHTHVEPNRCRSHAGAATLLTALQAKHHLMLILTPGLRPFVNSTPAASST